MISARVPLQRFAVLICTLWLVISSTLARPMTASADDETASVEVTLTQVSPSVLASSGELVLTGTVTNNGSEPLTALTVRLWRDARPITSLDLMDPSSANSTSGAVMQSPSARDDLGDGSLAVGETKPFTVRAEMGSDAPEQTWLSEPGAAYRIGVEVDSLARWDDEPLGEARTFIALPGSESTQVAPVVELNTLPSMTEYPIADQPGVIDSTALGADLVERIIPLTTFAVSTGAQLVVDPMLVDEVTALAATTSPSAEQAVNWLSTINELLAAGKVARGLYGSPDIRSLLGVDEDLALTATAVPEDHPLAAAPLWVVPTDGLVDQNLLEKLGAAEVILAANTSGTTGTTRVLRTSTVIDPHNGLWETWAGAEQVVAGASGTPLVQVLTSLGQTSWFEETSALRTLVAVDEVVDSSQPVVTDPEPQVDQTLASTTRDADATMTTWCSMVGERACPRRLLLGAWSTRWDDDQARNGWLRALMAPAQAGTGPDGVTLTVSDWVTTSAEDNQLPVSITNHTRQVITVGVGFTSANTLRIEVPDSELVTIGPGETSTVRVRPQTHGNGIVAVTAQPVAPSGQSIGSPVEFSVTGTNAGRLGWVIIIGSGVVLLAGTAMRVRQVRHQGRVTADRD